MSDDALNEALRRERFGLPVRGRNSQDRESERKRAKRDRRERVPLMDDEPPRALREIGGAA